MPIKFTIYEEHKVFVSHWVGVIVDSEILPAYRALYAKEQMTHEFNKLSDLRKADVLNVTSETLHHLSSFVASYYAGKGVQPKTAVIAPKDLAYGLARMYELTSGNSPEIVMVFRNPNEAIKWLGLDDTFIETSNLLYA